MNTLPIDSEQNDVPFSRRMTLHQVWEYLDKIYPSVTPNPIASDGEPSNDERPDSDK